MRSSSLVKLVNDDRASDGILFIRLVKGKESQQQMTVSSSFIAHDCYPYEAIY